MTATSAPASTAPAPTAQPAATATRIRQPAVALIRSELAVPVALYLFAVAVGLVAALSVVFPTNEASAYYVSVARNLASGHGLTIGAMWSYATPPLVVPHPAFELWQPMASFIAAVPIALFGYSFLAAQLGGVLVGAVVAPLTWAITRDSAPIVGTPSDRVDQLAVGAGIVVSLTAPFLIAVAIPDSTLPFLVFGTLACWLAPRALYRGWRWGAALGIALGLTYLARNEAVYIGAIFVGVALARRQGWRAFAGRLAPVVIAGLLVVGPWLLRDYLVFGTPLPGQALDNAFLTSNEQIFDYGSRPTLDGFLAQGWYPLVTHVIVAAAYNVFDVSITPTGPVTLIGAIGSFVLARRARFGSTPLAFLLASGLLTLLVATLVFPVASVWGTFRHGAGPFIVGLVVASVLATDRLVDDLRRRRAWQRRNAWLAPLALALIAFAMTAFQLVFLIGSSRLTESSANSIATFLRQQPEEAGGGTPVITDKPIWLNMTSGLPMLALPAQSADVVLRLAHDQGAALILVAEQRGPYPAAFRSGPLAGCFVERTVPPDVPAVTTVFEIAQACR